MKKKKCSKTDRAIEFAVNVLQTFWVETGHIFPEESQFSISFLNQMLVRFYIASRNIKRELYKLNPMKSIRFSLQMYFVEKFKCDISDQPFHEANAVFTNVLKDIKAKGKGDNALPRN